MDNSVTIRNRHTGEILRLSRVRDAQGQIVLNLDGSLPPRASGPPLHVHFHQREEGQVKAGTLAAQLKVARADFMVRDARLENFEASVHLTSYEVGDERWSLAAIDKQISRRQDDTKLVPQRAARLDLRSLARLNYSQEQRQQATDEVQHLTYVRGEIVRQIEVRATRPWAESGASSVTASPARPRKMYMSASSNAASGAVGASRSSICSAAA